MPIYEYRCQACGHGLEALQKMSEDALTECPACNKPALQKQVSASSFQLKGTGWYATDFKTSNKPPETKKDTAAAPESSTPAAAVESKPTTPKSTEKDGK
jgi:putative FmdB family regulatory protein